MSARDRFQTTLAGHYAELFASKPDEYAYAASLHTPESLAAKMTASMAADNANKDGEGIKRTCKSLGIKHTYAALRAYFAADSQA